MPLSHTLKQKIKSLPLLGWLARWTYNLLRLNNLKHITFTNSSRLQQLQDKLNAQEIYIQTHIKRLDKQLLSTKELLLSTKELLLSTKEFTDKRVGNIDNKIVATKQALEKRMGDLDNKLDTQEQFAYDLVRKQIVSQLLHLNQKMEQLHTEPEIYHFIQKQFLAQSLLYHDKLQALLQNPTEQNAKDLTKEYLDSYYLAFEDKFRGSRESILARYEVYYRFVPNTPQKALDIGCGRGEWVELLQAKGIESHGVDLNSAMLGIAKDAGVQNLHDQDAFAFLEATPAQSYDLISAFHIIEHIPFEKLLLLLTQIKRVAKQGATILLETPNPANLQVAANHFYNDPTHLNPLPHRVMEFMLEYLGFYEVKTHHINPYPKEQHLSTNTPEASTLNRHLHSAQDYIITAKA